MPSLLNTEDWRYSESATRLLREIAKKSGDELLTTWMNNHLAHEFSGAPRGYVYSGSTIDDVRIGLNVSILAREDSVGTWFVAGHELGHVRQVLLGQKEGSIFSRMLFQQELDASSFALTALKGKQARWLSYRYKSKTYHYILALESAYPWVSHALAAALFLVGSYFFSKKALALLSKEANA